MTSEEWLDGYDANEHGLTEWENPNDEHTDDFTQWLSGWLAADFDDRAEEQMIRMENSHGQATA